MASDPNFKPFQFNDLQEKFDTKSPFLGTLALFFVFFFTFLLIFIVYICTRRDEVMIGWVPPTNPLNRALSWRRRTAAVGLDAVAIGNLPTFYYELGKNNNGDQEAECCICLSIFEDGDKVKELPRCGHGFHSECVDKWLRNRSNCPLCRTPVVVLQCPGENSLAGEV